MNPGIDGVERAVASAVRGIERLVVLVSSGPDSTCLLHALLSVGSLKHVVAVHVNYGLRPESDLDEAFCRELAAEVGIAFVAESVSPGPGNLQDAARTIRYEIARRVAAEQRCDAVATGHTASDQVETVLYRLAASPGRRSLLGIPGRRGGMVRPLLGIGRNEVIEYVSKRGIAFREDSSNTDVRFARNRIRLRILPEMRLVHPAAERNILATRDELDDEQRVLAAVASDALGGATGTTGVEAGTLLLREPAVRRLALRTLAESVAGSSVAISSERADELVRAAGRGGTRRFDLDGVTAVCEYGVVRFTSDYDVEAPANRPVSMSVPGSCRFGAWCVEARAVAVPPKGDFVRSGVDEAFLDGEAVGSSVEVRAWEDGDRMRPLGLGGGKSLQDLFTDRKVPRRLRRRSPIIVASGRIAWIAGVVVSDEFKLTEQTRTAVRLRAWMPDSPPQPVPDLEMR